MSIDPRTVTAFEAENGFSLEPSLVVLALMGSHSHGTYLPPEEPDAIDDVDLVGLVVPPLEYHLGIPRWKHWTHLHRRFPGLPARRAGQAPPDAPLQRSGRAIGIPPPGDRV